MSLAKLCAHEFDLNTRYRGSSYAVGGRVTGLAVDPEGAAALVEGEGDTYQVELDFTYRGQGGMVAKCSCPAYDDGYLCKHIWAVLEVLDKRCRVQMPRGCAILIFHVAELDPAGHPPPEAFSARSHYEVLCEGSNGPPTRQPAGNWRRALQMVSRERSQTQAAGNHHDPRTSVPRERQIWYVLNVSESQRTGRLTLDLYQRTELKAGGWSKEKRCTIKREEVAGLPNEDDRWAVGVLLGNELVDPRYGSYGYGTFGGWPGQQGYSRCRLSSTLYELVLPRLTGTGRLVWLLDESLPLDQAKTLSWDNGEAWRCQIHMETNESAQLWRLTGEMVRGEQRRSLKECVLILPPDLVLFTSELARFQVGTELPWIRVLQRQGPLVIPFQDRDLWLSEFLSLPEIPAVTLPASLQVTQVIPQPQPRMEIKSPNPRFFAPKGELFGKIQFTYGDQSFATTDNAAGRYDAETKTYLQRNVAYERQCLNRLRELGCQDPPLHRYYSNEQVDFAVPARILSSLVRALVAEGWLVETQGIRVRQPGEFKMDVSTGVDWFELNGKLDFGGVSVALPALLAAVRNNEMFIRLDDGSQGMLPEEWLKRYGKLAELAETSGETLRFKASQGLLLDALLAEQQNVQLDQGFADYRQRLRSFGGVVATEPPDGFQGELRHYQKEGLGWLQFLREFQFGGCLADDMGLGKTVQVLAFLESRRTRALADGEQRRPSMVVVPKSLVFNWMEEARRFTPQMRLLNHTGIERGDRCRQADEFDLLITTYGTLRRDILKLKDVQFDYAVLDEAQAIKNAGSQAAKACRLIQANHRLAMTGTPVENHLGELWSLFDFLNPGMLGRSAIFSSFSRNSREYDPETLRLLSQALRPFLLRRTKDQVLKELPEKSEQTLFCELSTKERKAYDELRDYYRLQLQETVKVKGLAQSKIHVLEALLRLRQAACHPGLLDKKKTRELSTKLEVLFEQITEVVEEGHKALVFSQFTSLLDIVRKHLDERGVVYEYLDGQTRDRGARVKRFQEDTACPLFLISLKAGGHGLNLTAADYVFILDPWWNPAVEAQAVDRAHRIGQTRRVFAYRLIARNTVEDKILELQKSKRELADAIVSAKNSVIRSLTSEDLELLLS